MKNDTCCGLFMCMLLLFMTVPRDTQGQTTPAQDATTKEYGDSDNTDLPQADIDDALILDYGRYTTISFHYVQNQWASHKFAWEDRCHDHYTKCITSLVAPTPVCVYHSSRGAVGSMITDTDDYFPTYCDLYYTNCRIGYRYWVIIDYGKCSFPSAAAGVVVTKEITEY